MSPRSPRPILFTLALGVGALACKGDGFDPLDPDLIGDLGNDQGDAEGDDYTGLFATTLSPLDCDCPKLYPDDFPDLGAGLGLDPDDVIDPCAQLAIFYGVDTPAGGQVEIVQADGLLIWESWLPPLSGPVDADGSFSVGGSEDFSESFVEARLVSRVDAQYSSPDAFLGVMQQRIIAKLLDRSVDCRSTHQIDGSRMDPSPP